MAIPKKRNKRKPKKLNNTDPGIPELVSRVRDPATSLDDAVALVTSRLLWASDLEQVHTRLTIQANIKAIFDGYTENFGRAFQDGKIEQPMYSYMTTQFLPMIQSQLLQMATPVAKTEAVAEILQDIYRELAEKDKEANANNNDDDADDTALAEGGAASAGNVSNVQDGETN